jgi:uncharacterized protein
MKTVISLGVALLLLWGVVCVIMYFLQDRLLYHPVGELDRPGVEALRLKSGDASIKVWVLHPNAGPALIYFGGNSEDVGANLHDFAAEFPDRALYLVNYRGYGGSTGHPREAALSGDAEMVYDWVAAHHDRIVVMGRSLGSGIATALASHRPVAGVVLVTPYDSIVNVAADRYPWLPVRLLLKDAYDSVSRIGRVNAPVLVLVAQDDKSIRRPRTDALIAAIAPGMGRTVVVPGAIHRNIVTFPLFWRSVKGFLADLTPVAPATVGESRN